MRNKLKTILVLISSLFLFAMLILTIVDIVYGVWDHDAGYYLLRAKLVSRGFFPFADFQFVYFPFFIFINSFFYKLPISDVNLVFFIPFFWTLLNAFLSFKITLLKTGSVIFSICITILFFMFSIENGNNHLTLEQGIIFFTLSVFYFEVTKKEKYIPAAVGATVLSKQIGIIAVIYALYLSFNKYKQFNKVTYKYIISGLISVIMLFAMSKFDFAAMKFHLFDEFNKNVSAVEPFSLNFVPNEFSRSLFSFVFLILNFIIFVILFIKVKAERLRLFLIFLSLSLYLSVRAVRDYPHYSLNIWPYCLALFISFYSYMNEQYKYVKLNYLFFLVLAFVFLLQNSREFMLNRSKWSYGSSVLDFFVPFSEEVKQITKQTDKILVLGQENIIEYLADREPQDLKLPWYKSYDQISLDSSVVVLFNDAYAGTKEMHQKLLNNTYRLHLKKSFLIFPEPVGYIYVKEK